MLRLEDDEPAAMMMMKPTRDVSRDATPSHPSPPKLVSKLQQLEKKQYELTKKVSHRQTSNVSLSCANTYIYNYF